MIKKTILPWLSPILIMVLGTAVLIAWIREYTIFTVPVRLPGADGRPRIPGGLGGTAEFRGNLRIFDGHPSEIHVSWPGFRGPDYDAISKETGALLDAFGPEGPNVLWNAELGEGYAGAAVHHGCVYVMDYDLEKKEDAIRCFSLEDGREIWRYSYPVQIKRNHGMSRTIPAVTDEHIVTMGPKCHVVCLDSRSGELRWMIDLVREYGATEPLWYAGQCPRIEEGRAILAPGGRALMMAVECQTGQVLWETPNPGKWKMTHSSILPIEFAGRRMYVYCGSEGVAGVLARDGALLWQTDAWKLRINVPTPTDLGSGKIFLSAGYNKGSMMLQLREEDGQIIPEVLFELKAEVFGADQQTPIFYQGHLYGVRPDKQMVCMNPDGEILWTSGADYKFGLGPYVIADGKIFVLNDEGYLSVISADPAGFNRLSGARVLEGHESWGPPALAAGRLIVRDFKTMICLDLRKP